MIVTRLIPSAVKQPLKKWYLSSLLSQGLRALQAGDTSDETLAKLRAGWNNIGYDGKPVYLRELIAALQVTSGPVLECGSGLSTIVMAALAPGRDRISLEHNPAWAASLNAALQRHGLRADVRVAPLTSYPSGVRWYSLDRPLPRRIDLMICDGPDCYGRGRYGALPLVGGHLAPGALILFDDATQEGQPQVLDDWAREFGAQVDRKHSDGVDYAVVRVPRLVPPPDNPGTRDAHD